MKYRVASNSASYDRPEPVATLNKRTEAGAIPFLKDVRMISPPKLRKSSFPFMIFSLTMLLLVESPVWGKRKDDVVVMKNGDRFTGEIKGLSHGELIFKSSYMTDSVHLDWRQVGRIESKDKFIIELNNGERVTGGIREDGKENKPEARFRISSEGQTRELNPANVISIHPNETTFWHQLTGSIDYGLSFASANSAVNSSLSSQVGYTSDKHYVQLATSSQFSAQTGANNTNRYTLDLQYIRAIAPRWGAAGIFSALKSNEQDLDLRTVYGGGIARRLLQSDRTALVMIGGAAYTREGYDQPSPTLVSRSNAEGLLAFSFSTFKFRTLDLGSYVAIFPGITDPGRIRLSSQSRLRIELVRNFYWVVQLYENYDTRPPVQAHHNDLGVTTSLGWKF